MHKIINLFIILALTCLSTGLSFASVHADDAVTSSGITLSKLASSDNASVGDTITYTYTITNGNTSDNLTGISLTDNKINNIVLPKTELAAGESMTATGSYIVSVTDYKDSAVALVNTAVLAGVLAGVNVDITTEESVALNEYAKSLTVAKSANRDTAALNEEIIYTYTITNNGDVEISNPILTDNKLGVIPLVSDNITITSLKPGEEITVTATYKVIFSNLLAGSIKNIATITGNDANNNPVSGSSEEVVVTTNIFKNLLTKAQILILGGVPGKGIENAPGLQKPFNPNSQASEHAGKKDGKGSIEQNTNQEMNGNMEQNTNQEMNGNTEKNKNKEKNNNKK